MAITRGAGTIGQKVPVGLISKLKRCQPGANGAVLTTALSVAQSPFIYKGKPVSITVSIGVALKEIGQVCNIDEILSRADDSLYVAKSAGRNQVVKAA